MKKKSAFHTLRHNLREGGFFKLRVLFGLVLCFSAATVLLFALNKASAQPRTPAGQARLPLAGVAAANKIAPWVTEHTANGQQAEFLVVLSDQADLSQADSLQTKAEKGRYVYNALLNKSQTTQGPILQLLRERGLEHQSFYIVNAILVKGTARSPRRWQRAPTWRGWKAIRTFKTSFLNQAPLLRRLCTSSSRRRSNRASITHMRLKCGRWDLRDRLLLSPARIPAFAGHTTPSNLTIAAGTE